MIPRPKYGYIWFPSCLIAAAFIFFYLPEVKGRTLEEIDEMVSLIFFDFIACAVLMAFPV